MLYSTLVNACAFYMKSALGAFEHKQIKYDFVINVKYKLSTIAQNRQ